MHNKNNSTRDDVRTENFTPGPSFVEEFSSNVLYEDNHLLGLYKPAGLLVQGDHTGRPSLLDMAKHWLKLKYQKPGNVFLGMVHRVDRPVGGVVMFARTSKAAARLSAQIRNRTITKIYQAVVHGRIDPWLGVLKANLVRKGRKTIVEDPDDRTGQYAHLSYRTVETTEDFSLLEIRLVTGRRHQIRAQLAAKGHPILGDTRYGSQFRLGSHTIALLGKIFTCQHPTKSISITLEAPLPHDWPWPPENSLNLPFEKQTPKVFI
ncbi:MAG: RluA family pseudouridine synthase [Desulfobacteria bacterium]